MAPPKPEFDFRDLRKFSSLDKWVASPKEIRQTIPFVRTGAQSGRSRPVRLHVEAYKATREFQVVLEERPGGRMWLHFYAFLGEVPLMFASLGAKHVNTRDPEFTDPCSGFVIVHEDAYEKRKVLDCRPPWGRRVAPHLKKDTLQHFFIEATTYHNIETKAHPHIKVERRPSLIDAGDF